MRVCIHKLTQRLREAQTDATPGTLLANVAAAGDDPAQFEERDASPAEYAALLEAAKPPPSAAEIARAEARADAVIQYLATHTPAECEQYVQDTVTDLASAKAFLRKVAVALCVLARGI